MSLACTVLPNHGLQFSIQLDQRARDLRGVGREAEMTESLKLNSLKSVCEKSQCGSMEAHTNFNVNGKLMSSC